MRTGVAKNRISSTSDPIIRDLAVKDEGARESSVEFLRVYKQRQADVREESDGKASSEREGLCCISLSPHPRHT